MVRGDLSLVSAVFKPPSDGVWGLLLYLSLQALGVVGQYLEMII